jgi:hypothetical protein
MRHCKLQSVKMTESILFHVLFYLQVQPLDWKEWLICIAIGFTTCIISWTTRFVSRNVNVSLDVVWFRRSLRTQSGRTGSGRAMSGRLTNGRQMSGRQMSGRQMSGRHFIQPDIVKQISGKQQNAEQDQPRHNGHVISTKVYPYSE